MGVCNCSMFCCTLLYVHSSIAIILVGKRELIALLNLSFWCLVMVERLFLAVPQGCLQFVIVVFPDHTHLLFLLTLTVSLRSLMLANTKKGHNWTFDTTKCAYFSCISWLLMHAQIIMFISEKYHSIMRRLCSNAFSQ